MYEEHFDDDWDSLTQEEAMFRAYALGVDAAFGIDHPDKLDRLRREFHRGLVQIAFDEGESQASDEITERGQEPTGGSTYEFEPSEYDWEIWDELVSERESDPEALEMVRVSDARDSRPSSLDRPSLLDRPDSDSRETLRLPRFLLR